MVNVIYQTRGFHRDILTPRRELKILCSWQDFANKCFFSGCMLWSGREAARGLVRSRVEIPPAGMRGFFFNYAFT